MRVLEPEAFPWLSVIEQLNTGPTGVTGTLEKQSHMELSKLVRGLSASGEPESSGPGELRVAAER
jgi:hypothetical protein